MGTSLKGKKMLPEGVNSFLYEQFLIVWKITLITLRDPHLWYLCLVFVMLSSLFFAALWSPAGKGLTS